MVGAPLLPAPGFLLSLTEVSIFYSQPSITASLKMATDRGFTKSICIKKQKFQQLQNNRKRIHSQICFPSLQGLHSGNSLCIGKSLSHLVSLWQHIFYSLTQLKSSRIVAVELHYSILSKGQNVALKKTLKKSVLVEPSHSFYGTGRLEQ